MTFADQKLADAHFNKLTPAQDERLAKLAEECAEVIQAVCKILRHGYDSRDPTKDGALTNRRDLEREVADVKIAITKLCLTGDIHAYHIDRAYFDGVEKGDYMHHQDEAA